MAFKLAQNQFEASYKAIDDDLREMKKRAQLRLWTARILKGIAVFGGIAIATNLPQGVAQWVGIGIACAVAIDQLSANHMLLEGQMRAAHAYRRTLDSARNEHRRTQDELMPGVRRSDRESVLRYTGRLNDLRETLYQSEQAIKEALEDKELGTLKRLSLDEQRERSGPSGTPPVSGGPD